MHFHLFKVHFKKVLYVLSQVSTSFFKFIKFIPKHSVLFFKSTISGIVGLVLGLLIARA